METIWRALTEREVSAEALPDPSPAGTHAPRPLVAALLWIVRRSILRRGMFRAPMARLVMRLNGGSIDTRFRGASFRLTGDTNLIEAGLMLVPDYNGAEIDFLLGDAPVDAAFVDIGSNVGLYSLSLAAARPQGRVLAIDVNPRMVDRLAWNARASGLGNVAILHAGVSETEGRADLVIRKNDVAIVAIRENPDGAMPLRPLAALVAEAGLQRLHGLKIDVEGHEDPALGPFLETADDALLPRRIVIETAAGGTDYPRCAAAMGRRGYRLVGRTRNNSLYQRDG